VLAALPAWRNKTTFAARTLRARNAKQNPFDMAENKNQQPAINIEISEEVAEGVYSNLAIISHSHSEFVLDFIRMMPNVPKAKVKARVILTPQHAKRLLYALKDNLQKYEMQFGKIDEPEQPPFPPMNFNTPPAQA
jgi:hypothetical protein